MVSNKRSEQKGDFPLRIGGKNDSSAAALVGVK